MTVKQDCINGAVRMARAHNRLLVGVKAGTSAFPVGDASAIRMLRKFRNEAMQTARDIRNVPEGKA